MHKLWQLKQVVRVQGGLVVDRVNMFGGTSSGPIFISVNSLVAWVAKTERLVENLTYVDDSFGLEEVGNMSLYAPYGEEFPSQQTRLLQLWDEVGIPHKRKKQIFGSRLTILGIDVDLDLLSFTLPQESKDRLSAELEEWSQKGVRRKVKQWQQLAGWVNWALNVYPLLRPALNNIYGRLRGKAQESRMWANNAIREDLRWAKDKIDSSDGVCLVKSLAWEVSEATCIAFTDACPRGFAFWYPRESLGFVSSTPRETPATQITFYEALAVLSVLEDTRHCLPSGSKIIIYTDNFSTVAMFSSLRALPEYNCIVLRAAADIAFETDLQFRVLHVAGVENEVADALSREELVRAITLHPGLVIRPFKPFVRVDRHQLPPILQPPRASLGASAC